MGPLLTAICSTRPMAPTASSVVVTVTAIPLLAKAVSITDLTCASMPPAGTPNATVSGGRSPIWMFSTALVSAAVTAARAGLIPAGWMMPPIDTAGFAASGAFRSVALASADPATITSRA